MFVCLLVRLVDKLWQKGHLFVRIMIHIAQIEANEISTKKKNDILTWSTSQTTNECKYTYYHLLCHAQWHHHKRPMTNLTAKPPVNFPYLVFVSEALYTQLHVHNTCTCIFHTKQCFISWLSHCFKTRGIHFFLT